MNSHRYLVNLSWRELGYPLLPQTETWRTAVTDAPRAAAAEMVREVRAKRRGLHGVRVSIRPIGAGAAGRALPAETSVITSGV